MSTSRLSLCLASVLFVSTALIAREPSAEKAPVITVAAAGEGVRFSSIGSTAQIRVQMLSAAGDVLFDSQWLDGSVLDWTSEPASRPFINGTYRCVVTVKDLDGKVMEKELTLAVRDGKFSVEPPAAEENGPKVTMLAHDGTNGAVISTSGDLSFRFGNFLTGSDKEKMRLTVDGDLYLDGLIHAGKGIMLPDGTVVTSAAGLPTTQRSTVETRQPTGAPAGAIRTFDLGSRVEENHHLTPKPNAADYQFKVDATGVHIGTTSAFGLTVAGDATLSSNLALAPTTSSSTGVITAAGLPFVHNFGNNNAFLGRNAGNFAMTGAENTGIGSGALLSNTTGLRNTAVGAFALVNNTTGYYNTAVGWNALNTNNGINNTALGYYTLQGNTTGSGNTAVGYGALYQSTVGGENIAIGDSAGAATTGDFNIDIANAGVAAESGTIRIGTAGNHLRTFISGIRGVTTVNANAVAVMIDSAGQLGTVSSSRRYKFDIADMGDATDAVMGLRPVTFRYIAHGEEAPLQYGLIAEEVANVYPEMVTRDQNGEPDAVMYQFLAPMLLNQVQKQQRRIEKLERRLEQIEKQLEREK